ncbi:MAG: hypothetical protein HW405_651 [Candidatus Berkelbacteria bacterium]|nr:hypothetical protein [Candidatus Berkelbacteria bacterium]
MTKRSGIASIIVAILIAAGLIGGTGVGYAFREPLKKMIKGQSTQEEIDEAVENELTKSGQSKFELEGVSSGVDTVEKIVTVKIKSSTDSIKELQLSETPIKISDTARIQMGNQKDLKIADIPINSQVHMGGTIAGGILTAEKVLIQKEDVDEQGEGEGKKFEVSGIVKSVGTDSITVNVSAASKKAKSQRGKDLEIKIISTTVIEKSDVTIALTDIKVSDGVEIEGVVNKDAYTASKIEVKVPEEGETIDDNATPEPSISPGITSNGNSNRGDNSPNSNSNKNKDDETDTE